MTLIGAGEQQQVLHQPPHALGLGLHEAADALDVLAAGMPLAAEHLELAPDRGQGRAQLVRGVGDEAALASEGILQPVEHVIEGLGQHAGPRGASR